MSSIAKSPTQLKASKLATLWSKYDHKFMLWVATLAQALTLWITWPLWNVREYPPHLPVWSEWMTSDLRQLPFGWMLLASLLAILIRPRFGFWLHVVLLGVAFFFDQMRTQPQFIANAFLIAATILEPAKIAKRWFLVSLWIWAGLHKLISEDWLTFQSLDLVSSTPLDPVLFRVPFAYGVALGEIAVGILAIIRPKWGGFGCIALHVGISIFLTPLMHGWNYSVLPWNLATALIGSLILFQTTNKIPTRFSEWSIAVVLLLYPLGFYVGLVDHGIASVLYSHGIPDGTITSKTGWKVIDGWGEVNVPFPNERRTLRAYFERTAQPGDKLHIHDPRWLLPDLYFRKAIGPQAIPIGVEEFYAAGENEVAGVGFQSSRSLFVLAQSGARMKTRKQGDPIFAIEFDAQTFAPELLTYLSGLPNIEQIQLADTKLTDEDLDQLPRLEKLIGVGVSNTQLTDAAIDKLLSHPNLIYIEYDGTSISEQGAAKILAR